MTPAPWTIRRRIVNCTLLFCASAVSWILLSGDDRAVAEVIALGAFGLAGSVIGAYIFGATWDDHNARKAPPVC